MQLVVDNDYDFSSPDDVYNLTIVGTTATASGVIFHNNRYFTLRYINQIVWNGTSFFNGSGASNAPNNTTDACFKLLIKPGSPANLADNTYVKEVEVETGATLNVADGKLLTVKNQLVINGTIDLIGEAQLIQTHTGSTANSGSGNLKMRQQGTSNLFNYNYWSAPVNRGGSWQIGYLKDGAGTVNFTANVNANAATSPITLSSRWLYNFNGPTNNYNSWNKITTTTNLSPGTGYTMKGSGAFILPPQEQEYIFEGTPNNGDYTSPIIAAGNDFLTGNPYPSALSANQFINDNLSVIDGTLYFWEQFATNNSHYLKDYEGGHAIYNLMGMGIPATADASGLTSGNGSTSKPAPTQFINVGQGFFVTIQHSGSLVFKNTQRVFARESLNETVFFKSSTKNKQAAVEDTRTKIWFAFTKLKSYSKFIGLGYDSNTTHQYDNGYDAKVFDQLKNDLYWLLGNDKLVIQALPEINIQDNLPLGIKISEAGLYTFSIDKMQYVPDDLDIYLKDNIQNIYYNLREGEVALFLNKETKTDQFSITFQKETSLGTTLFESNLFYTSYNSIAKILELHTNEPFNTIETIKIFNVMGQEVVHVKSPKSTNMDLSRLSDGIYVLQVISKTVNNVTSIKFVKY
ncbi:T9SS type A sorting domain-containing protein [Mariniflexile sp.]|uniref:T9SS type A sorting domain-containing protein n=1 Tax=Mariniflexile sp. TaxID=1979402 RepID=UPI0040483278